MAERHSMDEQAPHGNRYCGAKTRAGTPCRRFAMANGRCPNHGGKSLSSAFSPTLKHGRYSKSLPIRLASQYAAAQQDAELLALREEIALTDTLLADTIGKLDEGGSRAHFQSLRKKWDEYERWDRQKKDTEAKSALFEVGSLILEGLRDFTLLDDIAQLVEQRRKLSESERKRLVEMRQMVTSEQAMILVTALVDTVRRHVTDRATLAAISNDVRRLVDRDASTGVSAAD